jgi:hypothetical protein
MNCLISYAISVFVATIDSIAFGAVISHGRGHSKKVPPRSCPLHVRFDMHQCTPGGAI